MDLVDADLNVADPVKEIPEPSTPGIELPNDIFHLIIRLCPLKVINRVSLTSKKNGSEAFRKIKALSLKFGGANCNDRVIRHILKKTKYFVNLEELNCDISSFAPLHHFYVLMSNVGHLLRRVRVTRLRSGRSVAAASILPFLSPAKIEVLHCDYDCCVPLMVMLKSKPMLSSRLKELTIPIHGTDTSDQCAAAEPQVLGRLIAKNTGKLQVLRLVSGRESMTVPKTFANGLLAPVIKANIASLKEITFGADCIAILDAVFPQFKQQKHWAELPSLFLEKFGIPISILRFSYSDPDGTTNKVTAAAEFCTRFRTTAPDHVAAIMNLCEASHPKTNSFKDILLKLSDYSVILDKMRAPAYAPLHVWILDRCEQLWKSELGSSYPRSTEKILFGFLRLSEIDHLWFRIKPLLLRIPDLLYRLATAERFFSTWNPMKPLKRLVEDAEWCEKAEFDINRIYEDKAFLSHVWEDPEVFVASIKTHSKQLKFQKSEDESNFLEWAYQELFWCRHRLDRFEDSMKAIWEFCATVNRAAIVYPSQISVMKWILNTKELRNAIAEYMVDWKKVLNPRVIRKACFDGIFSSLHMDDLKEMVECNQGKTALSPELSVKVSEFIWHRMIASPNKDAEDISHAATAILDTFPTLPPKLLRFLIGKTNAPLKLAEKATLVRSTLQAVMKERNLDYDTLAVVAKVK